MPTRISAGVDHHPCFFTFIYVIPIDHKITNFSLYLLLVCSMHVEPCPTPSDPYTCNNYNLFALWLYIFDYSIGSKDIASIPKVQQQLFLPVIRHACKYAGF